MIFIKSDKNWRALFLFDQIIIFKSVKSNFGHGSPRTAQYNRKNKVKKPKQHQKRTFVAPLSGKRAFMA